MIAQIYPATPRRSEPPGWETLPQVYNLHYGECVWKNGNSDYMQENSASMASIY